MIGQGRPNASRTPFARFARPMPWLARSALVRLCAAAIALCSVGVAAPRARAAENSFQLRIAWGNGAERIWQGTIRLTHGKFSDLRALGIEADEPGSIWLDAEGIEIRQRSLRAYDGVDVTVTAELDDQLVISLSSDPETAAKPIEIPLRSIASQSHSSTLDETGNRLLVSRSAGDRLRIQFDRDNLVFSPGETFQFALSAYLLGSGGPGLRYKALLASNPGGQEIWTKEYESGDEGTETSIGIKVPDEEGVYDLTITAVQPSRLRGRLRPQKPLAERKLQFVVIDARVPNEASASPMSKVIEINPVNPRWWERFGNIPSIFSLRKGPLGNGDAAPWEHPKLGPLIQLGPNGSGPATSWEAYPLPINNPGQPHVLEIEYPSDVPQSLGISLMEPNAAGTVAPIGLDSGVYVSDEEAENVPQLVKHRVTFWPRTKTPLLLVTNRRQGSRAVYGKITVLGGAHSQFSALALGRSDNGNVLPPAFGASERPARLWAGYLDRPLFVENFSAPEALDSTSHRSLDDWSTFYQGGTRLVKYLRHVGYGGVMMSVFAEGSTIYPSAVLQPTPRYDTGAFFATGQDPLRKDGLELLFRLFDREGLTLIPALHFASPLPELEALKREPANQAAGLEWVGADGAPWLATGTTRQGMAPYYNLLDARVQEAMLQVVRELAARYASHPSFGGLALQLSSDGYAQLPGEEWGFDDQTIERFQRETQSRVPGTGPQRFAARAQYLNGPGRSAWVQWRAGVVAGFHRRVQDEVNGLHGGARLYLVGGTMLESRETQYRLRPTLLRRTNLDEALLSLGINTGAYRESEGIVLLRPNHVRPPSGSLPAQGTALEINLLPEVDRLFAGGTLPGSLFFHEPQEARLPSFDAKSPFGAANTYTWLVSEMSPSGPRNRRRFVHSLAMLDSQQMFDGGWLLMLGQEDSLKDIISVYRQLPGEPFETVSGEFQPITIRTLVRDRQTYVYLINDSPWEASISMRVDLPADCKLERLGASRGIGPLARTGPDAPWTITLRPYDLVAARLSTANLKIRDARVSISEQVRDGLDRRIKDLGARVRALSNPQPTGTLANAGFDLPLEDNEIPGWTVNAPTGGSIALDMQQKRGGTQSLKMSSSGMRVGVASVPFDPPATGRVAVDLWLRAEQSAAPPSVRIALEGDMREGRYGKFGLIESIGAKPNTPGDWMRYSFPVDDLPSEGLTGLSIHLELMTAGEVWVDDVQVFDLHFSEAERYELSKKISSASVKLEAGQLADCARLLEGYWPQFLVANVPLTQTPLAQRPRTARAPASPPKKPTVLENIKSYLPRMPLRD